jgi:hypothetical protein
MRALKARSASPFAHRHFIDLTFVDPRHKSASTYGFMTLATRDALIASYKCRSV